ncbi:MAG: hypothetical protein ACYTGX_15825 [Planctomycetota bacterium]
MPSIFRETEEYKKVEELRTKILADIDKQTKLGEWVEVDHEKWMFPTSQAAQKTMEDGATVLKGEPKGGFVIFTPAMSDIWRDYVIEGEFFAIQGPSEKALAQLGVRIVTRNGQLAGKAFTFKPEYCNKWIKVKVQVEGDTFTAWIDGEQVLQTSMGQFQVGKPGMLINTGATLKIKSARFMLNKIHKLR